jgi:hypothetical protein
MKAPICRRRKSLRPAKALWPIGGRARLSQIRKLDDKQCFGTLLRVPAPSAAISRAAKEIPK